MAKSSKPTAVKVPPPKDVAQVNQYITVVAESTTAIEKLVAKANDRINAIKAELVAATSGYEQAMTAHAEALFSYFEKHKAELTDDGKRQSATFGTGVLGQRWTPPRTKLKDEAAVLAYIVAHRLTEFYEEKQTLRRDVMLANQAKAALIPGVSFVRDRIVYVQPDQFDVSIELKKKVESI